MTRSASATSKAAARDRRKTGPTPKRDAARAGKDGLRLVAPEPTDEAEPDADEGVRPKGRGVLGWLGCLVVAAVHIGFVIQVAQRGDEFTTLLTLLVPAIVTAVCIRPARRHGWHRWLALVMLAYMTIPAYAAIVMLVGETWAIHRFWCVDYPDNPASRARRRLGGALGSRFGRRR